MFRSTPTKLTQLEMTASSVSLSCFGIDVVLVESDADVLGLDLDQLGQRILEPAADRDAAAQGGVGVGKLLAADLAGRIDAGAGLVDDDVGELGEQAVGRVGLRRGSAAAASARLARAGGTATSPTSPRAGCLRPAPASGAAGWGGAGASARWLRCRRWRRLVGSGGRPGIVVRLDRRR